MNRIAFIIESSNVRLKGYDYLPGAEKDLANWVDFLHSPLGGAWTKNELVVVENNNPISASNLRDEIFAASDKGNFVFIAFSGHGGEDEYGPHICLNHFEPKVAIASLTPERNCCSIWDCCRASIESSIVCESLSPSMDNAIVANMPTTNFTTMSTGLLTETYRCRTRFSTALSKCAHNCAVKMFACSKDEAAGEAADVGGLYTSLLIHGAKLWKKEMLNGSSVIQDEDVYTTFDAHNYAAYAIPPQQRPEYVPIDVVYPFAVRT